VILLIVYAVYIITNDGRPLVSEYFQSHANLPNDINLSALLASVQMFSEDITSTKGAAEKFQLRGMTYHLKKFGDFQIVMVTDGDSSPAKLINNLGWRFMQQYVDEIEDWNGNTGIFLDFHPFIREVVGRESTIDIAGTLDPTKKLTTAVIFKLPKDVQNTALAIVSLESATANQIAEEIDDTLENVKSYLAVLQEEGYLGLKDESGEKVYFIS